MKSSSYRYTFRFCCDPGFNDVQEEKSLLDYIPAADIDDVAVFANVEEINTGHMDFAEQEIYLAMMRRLQKKLQPLGVTLSVNHWHSIMHADLGKRLHNGQNFRLMVDVNGKQSDLCVCPMCNEWRQYIAQIYAAYAALHPKIVWVEDDFRYHNHDPLEWGGCFCDAHMALYAKKAGKPDLTREEFLAGVLQAGTPHPYRKIWLDTCAEELEQSARCIAQAVHAVSPETQVGLMSSVPFIHAAEGRRWQALLGAFAGDNAPVNRIHLPGYSEVAACEYLQNFNMVSMANRALIAPETQVYPELENFPYSRFAKSVRFTRFQLLTSLLLPADGITIDLYDLNGNGIVWQENYHTMLHDVKPFLEEMNETGTFSAQQCGVCVPLCETSAYTLHTKNAGSMESLYPQEVFWAGLLPAMGVPFYYAANALPQGQTVALSGQFLRNLTPQQITDLFAQNFVIINADALETLCAMGLGHLAGVESVRWQRQNSGAFAYEQVTNGKTYCGIAVARASAIVVCSDVLDVTYANDACVQEYTAFYTSYRKRSFCGQTVVNKKVMVYPFGNFPQPLEVPVMLRNSVRQAILQDVLAQYAPVPMVLQSPYLAPYWRKQEGKDALYLVNASTDPVQEVLLQPGPLCGTHVHVQTSTGECKTLPVQAGGTVQLPLTLPSLETALLTFT